MSWTFNNTHTGRTGTIQTWTVPTTGTYTITARGAQGGGSANSNPGGLGALLVGTFALTSGQQLKILVGQMGVTGNTMGGGGGGTFVTLSDNTALIVAGGGGGAPYQANDSSSVVRHAVITTSGQPGRDGWSQRNAGAGGTNGSGGLSRVHYSNVAAGGGGLTGTGMSGPTAGGGASFITGGAGGVESSNSPGNAGAGGFGGGGGAEWASMTGGGGGGGYSGGGAGEYYGQGGGGGSYNSGTSQTNTAGTNSGHGLVTITSMVVSSGAWFMIL